ncbi:MAG: bifunctional (p)ppGpp synthetase/guanosine-3',5'-bis(diphosphate) 3'-pyrophosphohydrolase, partial [Clostridiales bacterium]|nr:bifunctional (p)ppGpp synthetase/guanosine-3',5'-bis(diphosphate) 3'-pyrophosphohydrolase [Clostridiales bacterium]
DYKLKTHDVVEIITSAGQQGPSRDWLNIVKTQQAKAKIRQWFKKENREENVQRGREMLEDAAKRHNAVLRDLTKPEYYEALLKKFNMTGLEDVYAAVGYGGLTTGQVLQRLLEKYRSEQKAQRLQEKLEREPEAAKPPGTRGVIVKGEPNLSVRFAHCCSPLPGDDIMGYITRGRGVSVHRRDCPNVAELMQDEERIIEVSWASEAASSYTASVFLRAEERAGILMDISQLLMNLSISLRAVNAKTDRNGVVSVHLNFDVKDMAMLNTVIKNLRKIRSVTEVYRINT